MQANFHTHTTFCDGKSTAEQTVKKAVDLGFTALGFSGHSYTPFDPCGMSPGNEEKYRAEIARLKAAYRDRIELYCGVEQDYYSGRRSGCYDYAIGSVHYIRKGGEYLCVDWSAERTAKLVEGYYSGDQYAYAEEYFALVGDVLRVTGADIVGHFDLIRKFDENGDMFDESHPRYRNAVLRALDRLCPSKPVFEINTGAMAKGYRRSPYPSPWILRELHDRGCPIMISSDCHDCEKLDHGYEEAARLAKAAGFRSQMAFCHGTFAETEF